MHIMFNISNNINNCIYLLYYIKFFSHEIYRNYKYILSILLQCLLLFILPDSA